MSSKTWDRVKTLKTFLSTPSENHAVIYGVTLLALPVFYVPDYIAVVFFFDAALIGVNASERLKKKVPADILKERPYFFFGQALVMGADKIPELLACVNL